MSKADDIKKTYLAMIIKIGMSDGIMDQFEDSYISTIASKLNIPEKEVSQLREQPDSVSFVLPETYSQRIEFFYNLLFMMGIDDKVTEEEKELCREIGFKLCLNPLLMEDLIHIITKNLGKKVPVDQVVNAVIKYQN